MSHTKPLSQWIETVSTAFPMKDLALPQEKNPPASFMGKYSMTKKNRRGGKDRVDNFANGCPK